MNGLERKALIIELEGEKPKFVRVRTLDDGTETVKAKVNGSEARYVKVDALIRYYNIKFGEENVKLRVTEY